LGLECRNIPDGEGKQEDIQLFSGITSEAMQGKKLRSKSGSLQGGERKLAEIKNLEQVQVDFLAKGTS